MLLDLADELTRLAVVNDRAARNLDDLILAVLTERTTLTAFASVRGHDMLLILQMQQRPEVTVSAQDNRPAFTAVTAVRSAFRQVLRAMKVHTSCATLSRAAIDLDIINEVGHFLTVLTV